MSDPVEEWQLRYGRAAVYKAAYVVLLASLVRQGRMSSDEAKERLAATDKAASVVTLKDFVRATVCK